MSDRLPLDGEQRTVGVCETCGGPVPNRLQTRCGSCWVERCRRQLKEKPDVRQAWESVAHLAGVVAMNGKERCASCDRAGWDVGRYDQVACIEGTEYGPCSHELCGGVCEPWGRCNCACHRETNPKEHR